MRSVFVAAALTAVLLTGGCTNQRTSPPTTPPTTPPSTRLPSAEIELVQAYVDALNAGDDEAAAALLAEGAAAAFVGHAPTQDIAAFHQRLDCSATIESSREDGDSIAVEMRMESARPGHTCPDPGGIVTITFELRDGRIGSILVE